MESPEVKVIYTLETTMDQTQILDHCFIIGGSLFTVEHDLKPGDRVRLTVEKLNA